MHFFLGLFLFFLLLTFVGAICRRADRQRQAAAEELSRVMLDALPEDARERVLAGIQERHRG